MNSVFLVTLLILVPVIFSYEFPEKFERCQKNDPDLDNCLKRTLRNALQLIGSKGISSLNLPPIDPLTAPNFDLGVGSNVATFSQKYFDPQVFGLSNPEVKNAHLDLDKNELTYTLYFTKLEHKSKYEIDGKLNQQPLFGKGDCILTFTDVTTGHSIKFEEEIRNEKSHFKVKSYMLSVDPNKIHYQFDNLFDGDQQRAADVLQSINDDWKGVYGNIKEELEAKFAELFKFISSGLFDQVPVDEIFYN